MRMKNKDKNKCKTDSFNTETRLVRGSERCAEQTRFFNQSCISEESFAKCYRIIPVLLRVDYRDIIRKGFNANFAEAVSPKIHSKESAIEVSLYFLYNMLTYSECKQ